MTKPAPTLAEMVSEVCHDVSWDTVRTDGETVSFFRGHHHVGTMSFESWLAILDAKGEAEEKPSAPPIDWEREP